MHQAAHPQARHVHKKSEIPRVCHQRRILFAPPGFELRLQERIEFDILAVALGVGGVALRFGNVQRDFLERIGRGPALSNRAR